MAGDDDARRGIVGRPIRRDRRGRAAALGEGRRHAGQLVYDEPPAWYYPVRESLGAALLRAGRGADAEKVFREGLRRSPRNGWMLFGLLESLQQED